MADETKAPGASPAGPKPDSPAAGPAAPQASPGKPAGPAPAPGGGAASAGHEAPWTPSAPSGVNPTPAPAAEPPPSKAADAKAKPDDEPAKIPGPPPPPVVTPTPGPTAPEPALTDAGILKGTGSPLGPAGPAPLHDDTAALQAALDEAHAAGGGTIHLPAGRYHIAPADGDPGAAVLTVDLTEAVDLKGDMVTAPRQIGPRGRPVGPGPAVHPSVPVHPAYRIAHDAVGVWGKGQIVSAGQLGSPETIARLVAAGAIVPHNLT